MDELITQQKTLISEIQQRLVEDAKRHAPNLGTYSEALSRAVQDLDTLNALAQAKG